MIRYTHHAVGGELKEQASDGGSEKLGNPVEDATKEGDIATDEGTKGDSWVDVATGDVGSDCYGDEKSESVS